jgi:predicted transcriptional regulator
MTIRKDEVIEILRQMPDEVDVEELIYRLYLLEKLAAAEADIAAGRTLSAEEVKAQTASWRR